MYLIIGAKIQNRFEMYALRSYIITKKAIKIIIFKQCGMNLFCYLCMF